MSQATNSNLRRIEPYYFDCVVFQVEDALFSLPKGHFSRSPVFATTFTLPLGDKDAEGTSDKPFVLQGINEADFVSLLKVMYPVPFTSLKLTIQEWISVLKLSTMWEFTEIREGAIQELSKEEMEMGTIDKIVWGRNYEVKKWLLNGYIGLIRRGETITDEEADRLGWKTAAKLLRLREQFSKQTRTPALGEICKACKGSGFQQINTLSHLCSFCSGYGRGIAGVTGHITEQHIIDAIQKEFPTEL